MMTDSPYLEIKVQGCWSVRNLAFGSDDKLKGQIMEAREAVVGTGGRRGEDQAEDGVSPISSSLEKPVRSVECGVVITC